VRPGKGVLGFFKLHHRLQLPFFEHGKIPPQRCGLFLQVLQLLRIADAAAVQRLVGFRDPLLLAAGFLFRMTQDLPGGFHQAAGLGFLCQRLVQLRLQLKAVFDLGQPGLVGIDLTVESLEPEETGNTGHSVEL
jgi:hypothetical protein